MVIGVAVSSAAAADDQDIAIDVPAGALHGSLLLPELGQPGPAVLLIAGSGPTDRDGNSSTGSVRPDNLRQIARGLAERGIASLRYDKRGLAGSRAAMTDESGLRFNMLVDDAAAWARRLAEQPGVTCVILAGHSEGALIAAMAAQRSNSCGVVEMAGAGRPAKVVLAEQLTRGLPPADLGRALRTLDTVAAGGLVADPPMPSLFRPAIQPFLASYLSIDPAAELVKARVPALIIQGERDIQVSVQDARALARARPDAPLLLLPTANHVLKQAPVDRAGNIATYADPALPIDAAILPAMLEFIDKTKPHKSH
ncbi:alpha/beta hydrolase [soil metagenome]